MNNNLGGIMNPNMGMGAMGGMNGMGGMGGMGGMNGMGCMGGMNGMNDINGMGQNMGGMNTCAIDPTAGMSIYTPQGSGTLISDIVRQNDEPNADYPMQRPRPMGENGGRGVDPYTGYPMANNNQSAQQRNPHTKYDRADHIPQYNYKKGRNDKRGSTKGNPLSGGHYGGGHQATAGQEVQSTDTSQEDNDDVSEYSNMRELANDVNNSLEALEQIENSTKYKKRKNKNASKNKETESDTENQEDQDMPKDESKITLETIENENDYLKLFVEFLLLLTLYVVMSQPFVVGFASGYITQLNPDEEGGISMMGIIIYGLIMTIMFFVIRKIMFSKM